MSSFFKSKIHIAYDSNFCVFAIIPPVSKKKSSICRVLNSACWQQNRLWHLQVMVGNCGIKVYSEAAPFTLKLNAVFILQVGQNIYRQIRQRKSKNAMTTELCCCLEINKNCYKNDSELFLFFHMVLLLRPLYLHISLLISKEKIKRTVVYYLCYLERFKSDWN